MKLCHNPYFNRWFSAINNVRGLFFPVHYVTILILIDGFLQSVYDTDSLGENKVTILILIDGFLQYGYFGKLCQNSASQSLF